MAPPKGPSNNKPSPKDLEINFREKYEPDWFVKLEKEEEQLTSEVVIADVFKIMMQHESLAPEIRVGILEDKKFTLSKRIKGFTIQSWDFDPSEIVNYHHMLAVCIFLGQHDMHSRNWGVVEEDGKKWAAVIDHGRCIVDGHIQRPEAIARALRLDHEFEHLVTKDFVAALLTVAEEAEAKKKDLREALLSGLERARLNNLFGSSNLSLDSLLSDIDINIQSLRMVAFSVQIQIAIKNLDLTTFKSLLADERLPHVIKNWPRLNLSRDENMDHFFDFITKEAHFEDLREVSCFPSLLYNVLINSNRDLFFEKKHQFLSRVTFQESPENVTIAVYETLSPSERRIVDDKLNLVVARFQPFRDAYLKTKRPCPAVYSTPSPLPFT